MMSTSDLHLVTRTPWTSTHSALVKAIEGQEGAKGTGQGEWGKVGVSKRKPGWDNPYSSV